MRVVSRSMTSTTKAAAANIRAELGRQDMSRAALARQLGVTEMWLSRRINAHTPITVDELAMIAAALDVTPVALLGEAS